MCCADNFWLLYELHPLAYFLEMLPLLHLEVQQLVLKVNPMHDQISLASSLDLIACSFWST
jgi:hypothetical protein